MSEQIGEADLQPLGTGGVPQRPGIASLKNPGTGEGGLQRRCGRLVGPKGVVAEVVCAALGHRAAAEHGGEHQIHYGEVVDHISYAPFGARCRRRPLVRADAGDQVAHGSVRTCEIPGRSGCHPTRLRRHLPGCPRVFCLLAPRPGVGGHS